MSTVELILKTKNNVYKTLQVDFDRFYNTFIFVVY